MTERNNGARGLSLVAGIRDHGGGIRIVITEHLDDLIQYHVGPTERAFVLPDLLVKEPLSIQQFYDLQIEKRVTEYMQWREQDERSRADDHRRKSDQQRHDRRLSAKLRRTGWGDDRARLRNVRA